MKETYKDEAFCDNCEEFTEHEIYDSGHERDSSGDWKICLKCKYRYSGMTGKYEPPFDIENDDE